MTGFITIVDVLGDQFYPASFFAAAKLAEEIVNNPWYYSTLSALFDTICIDKAREIIREGFFVNSIELKGDLDAYACIYVGDDVPTVRTLHFNPLLIIAAKKAELRVAARDAEDHPKCGKRKSSDEAEIATLPQDNDQIRLYTMFFAIKIIHEVSHVVNFLCNTVVTNTQRTPPKRPSPECLYEFNDFGAMVEYKLLGGVLEHHEEPLTRNKRAFNVISAVLYAFVQAPSGYEVTWSSEAFRVHRDMTPEALLSAMRPVLGLTYTGKSTGNREHLRLPSSRSSVDGGCDIGSGEEGEEDEDEGRTGLGVTGSKA